VRPPTDWITVKFTPQKKKDLVRFLVAGFAALLISKSEKFVNKKADDYFGPDVEKPKKNKK
jgi:hypothetical protein